MSKDEVRIFVAATPAEWLPLRVLEFSIREKTTLPVTVQGIYEAGLEIPTPKDLANRPRTPFSFQRFLIPEICGFSGRAIYLDADMQVFRDIDELWAWPFNGADLLTVQEGSGGRKGQFSVMLLDCQRLKWDVRDIVQKLDEGALDYAALMYEMRVAESVRYDLPIYWNSLEHFSHAETALLHYTDMNFQPWTSTGNPHGHLWIACLRRAIQVGFISREQIERERNSGHIRPSLCAQLDREIDSCVKLPADLIRLDKGYRAPYRRLSSGRARPWTSIRAAAYSKLKHCYYRSPLARWF